MLFKRNKDYATQDEVDEVRILFHNLEKQMMEITTGLGFAKWLLAASIGIVPIVTTLLDGFREDIQSTDTEQPVKSPQERFVSLPDGRLYDTTTGKVIK